MSTEQDLKYMRTALRLAERGIGAVEPNPAVGCVIVKGNQIIGKGWHKKFGDAHAEINAIEDCKTLGAKPSQAKMYVTLEPCGHEGKTAPCTQAIKEAQIAKVFVATSDPSEHAAGKGIESLRQSGIDVEIGLCSEEARLLNAPFMKFATTKQPWVILKWAQSIEGKLAWSPDTDEQRWISNAQSRKDAHALRRQVQGIMVGINTIIADNPLLSPRPSRGRTPARIVFDSNLRIPLGSRILRTPGKGPVFVVTGAAAGQANPRKAERIQKKGAQLLYVPLVDGICDLQSAVCELGNRGMAQLLVEGGPKLLAAFLKAGLADEIRVYIAAKILGSRGAADILSPTAQLVDAVELEHISIKEFEGDIRIRGLLHKV